MVIKIVATLISCTNWLPCMFITLHTLPHLINYSYSFLNNITPLYRDENKVQMVQGCHRLSGLKQLKFIASVLEARSVTPRCLQGHAPSDAAGGGALFFLSSVVAPGVPRFVAKLLLGSPVSSHDILLLCLSFFVRTSQIELKPDCTPV